MKRVPRRILMIALDNAIDEVARLKKENQEVRERAYDACEAVFDLCQEVGKLEQQIEELSMQVALSETREYNRAKRIGESVVLSIDLNKPKIRGDADLYEGN